MSAVIIPHAVTESASPYTVDGGAIVFVDCDTGTGTAFYVGGGRFLTARHVLHTDDGGHDVCRVAGKVVNLLSEGAGVADDWALFSVDVPMRHRITYSCGRIVSGGTYLSTGYANGTPPQVTMVLRGTSPGEDDRQREMRGYVFEGMSGGPTVDLSGVAYGINSWITVVDKKPIPISGVAQIADTPLCPKEPAHVNHPQRRH